MGGQVAVIRLDRNWLFVTVDLAILAIGNQTIVIGFLDPFIYDGARPCVAHFRSKDRSLVIECTWATNIATSLGEEDWNVVSLGHGLKAVVARSLIGCGSAPFVGVEAVEVDRFVHVIAAREIVLQCRSKLSNVGCGISDGDRPIVLPGHVGLHVRNSSLNKRGTGRSGKGVNDLVSDPESSKVVILLEGIHDLGKGTKLLGGPGWGILRNTGIEGVQVEPDIDAVVREDFHATIMVCIGVNMINAD